MLISARRVSGGRQVKSPEKPLVSILKWAWGHGLLLLLAQLECTWAPSISHSLTGPQKPICHPCLGLSRNSPQQATCPPLSPTAPARRASPASPCSPLTGVYPQEKLFPSLVAQQQTWVRARKIVQKWPATSCPSVLATSRPPGPRRGISGFGLLLQSFEWA